VLVAGYGIEIEEARRIAGYCFLLMRIGNKAPQQGELESATIYPPRKLLCILCSLWVWPKEGLDHEPRAISGLSPSFSGSNLSDSCPLIRLAGRRVNGPVVGRCLHLQMQVPGSEILISDWDLASPNSLYLSTFLQPCESQMIQLSKTTNIFPMPRHLTGQDNLHMSGEYAVEGDNKYVPHLRHVGNGHSHLGWVS
jgi:hypothetical protein